MPGLRLFLVITLFLTQLPTITQAETPDAHREGSVEHWSYFCQDICWVSTLTTDLEMQVYVSIMPGNKIELSAGFRDQRVFPSQPSRIRVGCTEDRLIPHGNSAYPSTIQSNDVLLREFQSATIATLHVGKTKRDVLLGGFVQALARAGHSLKKSSKPAPCPAS